MKLVLVLIIVDQNQAFKAEEKVSFYIFDTLMGSITEHE